MPKRRGALSLSALYTVGDPAASQTRIQNLEMNFTKPVSRVRQVMGDGAVDLFERAAHLIPATAEQLGRD